MTAKKKVMNSFVDTHTHLFCEEFNEDRTAAVERAVEAGVTCLCLPAINAESISPLLALCDSYPDICYPMVGLHPTDVAEDYEEQLVAIEKVLHSDERFIAIGEVGLDFYWSDKFRQEQYKAFEKQIDWAQECSLPLVIHSRNAFKELYSIMDKHRASGLAGVFHCFSGSVEEAEALLSFDGFYLGIGGVLTYKKSPLPQILENIPLERIVLETDSPYLAPVPYRGKRNESAYIPYIAEHIARIYSCTIEDVANVTTENALRLFTKIAK